MIFSEHFTLLSALEIMTPMEIVVNYETKDLIDQLYKHAAETDASNFIADVISEYEEIKEIVDTFITTCSCVGWGHTTLKEVNRCRLDVEHATDHKEAG